MSAVGLGHAAVGTAKGLGHAAVAAAGATQSHVIPALASAARSTAGYAAEVLSKATLSAKDIIDALNQHTPKGLAALGDAARPEALADSYKPVRRGRADTPPPSKGRAHSSSEKVEFPTVDAWLSYSKAKGILVEQMYRRPQWVNFVTHANGPELRKKLMRMTPRDLAEILVKLDTH
jgi:hypothetical protein